MKRYLMFNILPNLFSNYFSEICSSLSEVLAGHPYREILNTRNWRKERFLNPMTRQGPRQCWEQWVCSRNWLPGDHPPRPDGCKATFVVRPFTRVRLFAAVILVTKSVGRMHRTPSHRNPWLLKIQYRRWTSYPWIEIMRNNENKNIIFLIGGTCSKIRRT